MLAPMRCVAQPSPLLAMLLLALLTGCGSGSSPESTHGQTEGLKAVPVRPIHRNPAAHRREPALPGAPAEGVCSSSPGLTSISFNPDTPSPRCVRVAPGAYLSIANRTGLAGAPRSRIRLRFAGFTATIRPHEAVTLKAPVGSYLQPGRHEIHVTGAPGPATVVLSE